MEDRLTINRIAELRFQLIELKTYFGSEKPILSISSLLYHLSFVKTGQIYTADKLTLYQKSGRRRDALIIRDIIPRAR